MTDAEPWAVCAAVKRIKHVSNVRTGPGGVGQVVISGAPRELLQLPAAQVQATGGRGFFERPVQGTVPTRRSRHG